MAIRSYGTPAVQSVPVGAGFETRPYKFRLDWKVK